MKRPLLKSILNMPWWGLSNFGVLISVHRSRKAAVNEAIRYSRGQSWREMFEVTKLRLKEWE